MNNPQLIQEYDINVVRQIFLPYFSKIEGHNFDYFLEHTDQLFSSLTEDVLDGSIDPKLFIKTNILIYSISKLKEKINKTIKDGVDVQNSLHKHFQDFTHIIVPAIFIISYFSYFKAWEFVKKNGVFGEEDARKVKNFFSLSFEEIFDLSKFFHKNEDLYLKIINEHYMSRKIKPIYDKMNVKIYRVSTHKECRFLGGDTRWCTSSSLGADHLSDYSEWSNLYIFISDNGKYQLALNKIFQRDLPVVAAFMVLTKIFSQFSIFDYADMVANIDERTKDFLTTFFLKGLRNKNFYKKEFLEKYLENFAKEAISNDMAENLFTIKALLLLEMKNPLFMRIFDEYFKNYILSNINEHIERFNEIANKENARMSHRQAFNEIGDIQSHIIRDRGLENYFTLMENDNIHKIYNSLTFNDFLMAFALIEGRPNKEKRKDDFFYTNYKLYRDSKAIKERAVDDLNLDELYSFPKMLLSIIKGSSPFNKIQKNIFSFLTAFNYDLIDMAEVKKELENANGDQFLENIYRTILTSYSLFRNGNQPPVIFLGESTPYSLYKIDITKENKNIFTTFITDGVGRQLKEWESYCFLLEKAGSGFPYVYVINISYNLSKSPEWNYFQYFTSRASETHELKHRTAMYLIEFVTNILFIFDKMIEIIENDRWWREVTTIKTAKGFGWLLSNIFLEVYTKMITGNFNAKRLTSKNVLEFDYGTRYQTSAINKPINSLNTLFFHKGDFETSFFCNWLKTEIAHDVDYFLENGWTARSIFTNRTVNKNVVNSFLYKSIQELGEYIDYMKSLSENLEKGLKFLYDFLISTKNPNIQEVKGLMEKHRPYLDFFDYNYTSFPLNIFLDDTFLFFFLISAIKAVNNSLYMKFLNGIKEISKNLTSGKRLAYLYEFHQYFTEISKKRPDDNSSQNKILLEVINDLRDIIKEK